MQLLIIDGIYRMEALRIGNVYTIESADGLTLVDTSIPGSLPRLSFCLISSWAVLIASSRRYGCGRKGNLKCPFMSTVS